MKKNLLYGHVAILLMIVLLPAGIRARSHDPDSLWQAMQTASRESDRLHATVLFARNLLPAELDSAHALLESAAALRHSEDILHLADYYNAWGLYYWDLHDRQASARYYKKTLQLQPHPTIISHRAEAANHTGMLYFQRGMVDSARTYLHKAFEIDTERNNKEGMAKTMYDLSRLHRMQNQYELAFTYITEAIRIQKEIGDPRLLHFSYNVLGITHGQLGDKELAAEAYKKSRRYAFEAGMDNQEAAFYNNMAALWCQVEGMLDTTLYYAQNGLLLARREGFTDLVAALLTNKGQALLTAGEPAMAVDYFTQALEYIRQLGSLRMEVDVTHRKGRAHRALGNYEKARQAQKRTLEIAEKIKSPGFQSQALLELAGLDSLENKHEDFIRHYVKGIRLRDSIWSQENRSRIAELQIIHATEQKEQEIEQLRQQEQVRQLRMTTIVAASGFVFVLLLLVILYLGIRQKLIRQKYAMQQQQSEARLEANRRELTGKALSLAKSDQLIMQLKKDLRTMLDNTGDDHSKDLRSALQLLKSKDNSKELWKEFEHRFNELNEGFISRLTGRYPNLSPAEVRLCAMLRLHLSTKEIAEMIRRSTRTVENTRNSIRKKMGLQSGDNLVQHLLSL